MRIRQLIEKLRNDRFLRRLALLSGGTLAGQLVVLAGSPLLTRLYTPEQFGLFGVFSALAGIFGSSLALRYDLAIPVCGSDEEAAGMVVVAGLAAIATSAALGLAAWGLGPWLEQRTATPGLDALLWLLPAALLLWGLALPLSFWTIRQAAYRTTAANTGVRFTAQTVAQLGLGGIAQAGGLVLGLVLGYLAGLVHLLVALPAADRARWRAVDRSRLWPLALRHWRYPVYSTPSMLLQSAAQFLPTMLVAALYGPAAAGWFALAQRLLELPVVLLSRSAGAVFLGELRGLPPEQVRRLFLRTSGQFLALGTLGMTPLLLFGPALFALVFGEPWRMAGAVVQCLVPVQLARFVVIPISQALNIYGRQELHLVSAALGLAATAAAFALGAWRELPLLATLLLFGCGAGLAYVVYLALTWSVVRRAAAEGGAGHPPP